MICRILEQKDAIRQVLRTDSKSRHLCPSWQDIEVLESLQAHFTDSLLGENCATVSAIAAVLHILKTDVLADSVDDSTLTSDIKKRILEYMENKYEPEDIKILVNVTSYLDPRFCITYIDGDIEEIRAKIVDEGVLLVESLNQTSSANSDDQPPPAKKRKLGSWLVKARATATVTVQQADEPVTPEQKVKDEMKHYEHAIRVDPDCNPLDWWKVNATNYVVLSQLAKKCLCINASSSASERVFSTAGHIVSKKCILLKPDMVNMLVFLSKNCKLI